MKLYWWNRIPNLGDVLTWRILARLLREPVEWAPPREAEWVGIGSILESFHTFRGTVFGTGRGGPNSPPTDLRGARVLALRGKLTREYALVTGDVVLGEPGLLADCLAERDPQGYVAIVPHWKDQERMMTLYPGARFVDVMGNPHAALDAIAGAESVVSSSLHGIVLADAFGIPRMWDWFDGVQAKGFKFRDYGSVVGKFEPGQWCSPEVGWIQKELRECLASSSV